MTPVIFHADLDAFYASVEQLDFPELRGKPVIVGAAPGGRGVVAACSYEARKYGIHSAMPINQAYRRCPNAAFRPGRMERYREKSRAVMAVFGNFSPAVRQISVDEAFLDMTGTTGLFGEPENAARALKERIREEEGLTVSIGIGSNRYIAKLASARSKPDGLLRVAAGAEEAFMASLKLESVWGVGEKTQERLREIGLDTVDRIRALPEETLRRMAGAACGSFLYKAVRGIDPGIFADEPKSRSMSGETTFERDVVDTEILEATLLALAQELMFRLLEERVRSKTVHVKIRYENFQTVSIQETLDRWIVSADDIRDAAFALFEKKRERGRAIRLLGLGLANLEAMDGCAQGELFEDPSAKRAKVERAVLDLKRKRGAIVTKARLLNPGKT